MFFIYSFIFILGGFMSDPIIPTEESIKMTQKETGVTEEVLEVSSDAGEDSMEVVTDNDLNDSDEFSEDDDPEEDQFEEAFDDEFKDEIDSEEPSDKDIEELELHQDLMKSFDEEDVMDDIL